MPLLGSLKAYGFWTLAPLAMVLLSASEARAEDYPSRFRMRAREHFEELSLHSDGGSTSYRGFTNTINLGYESPFHYSVGFAGSPLFATLHSNSPLAGYARTIRIVYFGAEGKVFPAPEWGHVFVRAGWYDTTLSSYGSAARRFGQSQLAGLGYEFDLGGIGLAPDFAWRWIQLSGKTKLSGIAPSLGLHFYKAL